MDIKPLILIIEDDKPIARFLEISMETQGYRYISTKFGKEGIALAYSHNPDMIILDLGLPDIDGLEVIEKIKEIEHYKNRIEKHKIRISIETSVLVRVDSVYLFYLGVCVVVVWQGL